MGVDSREGKIVGIQYYKGICSRGEYVQLMREPANPVCSLECPQKRRVCSKQQFPVLQLRPVSLNTYLSRREG